MVAFIVEDGTGLVDATSLVNVAFADTYFSALGSDEWTALSEDEKKVRLNRGSQYACSFYNYKGQRKTSTQALCFPRINILYPDGAAVTEAPLCVKKVVCEMAMRASSISAIWPDPEFPEGGRAIGRLLEQIGPLKIETEYADKSEYINEARYPAVDALMCSWLIEPAESNVNGVIVAGPKVTGVSNGQMWRVRRNSDRYTGPLNENDKEEPWGGGRDATDL